MKLTRILHNSATANINRGTRVEVFFYKHVWNVWKSVMSDMSGNPSCLTCLEVLEFPEGLRGDVPRFPPCLIFPEVPQRMIKSDCAGYTAREVSNIQMFQTGC